MTRRAETIDLEKVIRPEVAVAPTTKIARLPDKGIRIGVASWRKKHGISVGIFRALKYLGYDVINFPHEGRLPTGLDVIFVSGPFGSLVPLFNQLTACPPAQRPALVYIMTEQLPNPNLPEWLRYSAGQLRARLERTAFRQGADGEWQPRRGFRWLITKLHRFRYYGELYWLRQQGLLSVLVIPSRWTADFLRVRGFDPVVLPPSSMGGEDLKVERDIPVLWLGKTGTARRGRMLERIRSELSQRGIEMRMVDGEENPYVFGEERTLLLNRTKIVLNILREKWDDNSMRYVLAAPCRALVVTEPTLPHSFFEPGIHIVETPFEKMADTIHYYLTHDDEREQIVEQAYQLVTQHSGLEKITQLLERALATRPKPESETS